MKKSSAFKLIHAILTDKKVERRHFMTYIYGDKSNIKVTYDDCVNLIEELYREAKKVEASENTKVEGDK